MRKKKMLLSLLTILCLGFVGLYCWQNYEAKDTGVKTYSGTVVKKKTVKRSHDTAGVITLKTASGKQIILDNCDNPFVHKLNWEDFQKRIKLQEKYSFTTIGRESDFFDSRPNITALQKLK